MSEQLADGGLSQYMEQLHPELKQQEESKPVLQEQQEPKVETAPTQKQSSQEQNWRAIRDRAENAERRAAELERQLMQQSQTQTQEEEDMDIGDDSLVEGKPFKRYMKNVKKELNSTKEMMRRQQEEYGNSLAEFKLKAQFNDFDSVVNTDNLEKLASQKPILYKSIMANGDLYEKGYAAYELIKNSVLNDNQAYAQQDRRIEENRNKPRSASNVAPQVGETPLSRVSDYDRRILTEERKEQLRRQVEEAKRLR